MLDDLIEPTATIKNSRFFNLLFFIQERIHPNRMDPYLLLVISPHALKIRGFSLFKNHVFIIYLHV